VSESDLLSRHPVEYPAGTPTLAPDGVERLLALVPGWEMRDVTLVRTWRLADFAAAIDFVNRVAVLAEAEGHHPNITIYGYRNVRLEFTTHSIGGLSENDFIMAAKVNQLG
jgi:4a-hydroxytetrahydrobiopterin dehydratase